MNIYNKYKDHPAHVMYELYHWEAHPSQYDDSHEFEEIPGDWWYQQPFTKPSNVTHRIVHYECYREAYPDVTIPALVDDGPDGNNPTLSTGCIVSKKFRAMYTSIVVIGLDKKIAFAAHWPPNNSGNWNETTAKQWVNSEYLKFDSKLEELLSGIDSEPPEVEVKSPSSGDDLTVGATEDITWTATDNVGVVSRAIYLSTDGSTWDLVDSADNNTGTYSWTVSNDVSNNCKIKVVAYDEIGNAGDDESGSFEIGATSIIYDLNKARELIAIRKNAGSYSVYMPFAGSFDVAVTDVQGKQIAAFTTTNGRGWYEVQGSLSSGMHIVSIKMPGRTIVSKVWFVR